MGGFFHSLVLKKVDESNNPVAGAIFLVLRDGQIISTEETKADGTIMVSKGIYGVTFLLYDANHNLLTQETTDNQGYAYFEGLTEGGRYYLKELENEGYIPDSMFKTFAAKYRTSMSKAIRRLRIGKHFRVNFTDKKGKKKTRLFYKDRFARMPAQTFGTVDRIPSTVMYSSKTSLMDRLSARQCELCGKTDVDIEMHHVRKLKDLKGKAIGSVL